jgi:23S rRNA (cytosine1962-C5)-methyltransferase
MLQELLSTAYTQRHDLITSLHNENTTAYRLFHGTNEGKSGLTVDRYGELVLIQTFHQSLSEEEYLQIQNFYSTHLSYPHFFVYNDRSASNSRYLNRFDSSDQYELTKDVTFQELGVNYLAQGRHKGQDPLLFLDFRAARRHILKHSEGKDVLNLFSYTCGIGVSAAVGGAKQVVNVDFAESALAVGAENASLNELDESTIQFIKSDFFTAARQMAGLPVAMRRGRQSTLPKYNKIEARQFDLVVLDPPKWAKSPFGTVDLVRDYSSVFKPALLCVKEGGQILCANNVAQVSLADWLDMLQRSAKKAGKPVKNIEVIKPEEDFPSRDGNYPLKMALLSV